MLESKQLSLTCPQFSIFRHEFLSCMLNDPSFYLQELTNMLENVSFDNYSCQLFIWSYQDDQIVWDFQNKSHIKNWRIYLEISHFLNKTLLLLLFFPYFFPMFLTSCNDMPLTVMNSIFLKICAFVNKRDDLLLLDLCEFCQPATEWLLWPNNYFSHLQTYI